MASVYDGMLDEFGVLAYAQKNNATLQFLQDRYDNLAHMGDTLTDYGRQWYEKSATIFRNTNGDEAMRYARGVIRKVKNVFQPNAIRSLNNLHDVQHSPAVMHRYLMAQPEARRMYQQQRIAGFPETYVDHNPGPVGHEHYDFRRVVNNVMRDDPEFDFRISHMIGDDLVEGDRELAPDEKFDVIDAWALIEASFKVVGGDDFSSTTGGTL